MPTRDELKTLYRKGAGTRNMTTLLKTTGWWIWSGETKGPSSASGFGFDGDERWARQHWVRHQCRGFAVRSQIGNKTEKVSSKTPSKGDLKLSPNEKDHPNTDSMTVFATCFCAGIAMGYIAKKKEKSFWKWGALGFFIFGPGLYVGVIIAVAFIAGISG